MSQHIEGPRKTFKAATALEAFRRVKITDPTTVPKTVGYAGATDMAIGVTERYHAADADCAIYLANAQGTRKMMAADAITGGEEIYAAANGKVASTGTVVEGKALESVTADGDILEVLPVGNSDISTAITGTTAATFQVDSDLGKPRAGLKSQTGGTGNFVAYYQAPATLTGNRTYTGPADADDTLVGAAAAQTLTNKTLTSPAINDPAVNKAMEIFTADDTLAKAETGKVCTNLGAEAAVTLTLPQDAVVGDHFDFVVMTAQELRIDPGAAGAIYINGAKQTDNKYISADDEGESVRLIADGNGDWVACFAIGTWTVEG